MKHPCVTSITYVKNCNKFIERCVRSVMNQTLKEIEIIIVDGGSTDGTLEIIKKLQDEDERIIVLHEEPSVGIQFNSALKIAKGEFIAVCEGDDFIHPEKYEKQYVIASKYKIDVLRACYNLFFEIDGKEYKYKVDVAPLKELYDRVTAVKDDLFLDTFVNGYWNGLYSREFLIDNNICQNETKGASYQDISFSFLTQMKAKRIWFMSEPLHYYRIDNPNASVNAENCIEMLNCEYELLSANLRLSGEWEQHKHMFLKWLMTSYYQFFSRFDEEKKQKVIISLYENLRSYQIDDSERMQNEENKITEIWQCFYKGYDEFYHAMFAGNSTDNVNYKFWKNENIQRIHKMIIFGAGHIGKIVGDYLGVRNIDVIYVDNSEEKRLGSFNGKTVCNPMLCIELKDCPIVIANMKYANEILNQLLNMGVEEDRIVICDNEDLFFREVFVHYIMNEKV